MTSIMNCCLHCGKENLGIVSPFSEKSWSKVKDCIDKWILFDCYERTISENLMLLEEEECFSLPTDKTLGYHKKCYQLFTDKTRISAAEKRCKNLSEGNENIALENTPNRVTRSKSNPVFQSRSHILPEICIICQGEKFVKEKYSGKRKREKLSKCETNTNNLLSAAIEKNDENLLHHLRNQDIVAIEVRYHRSCYKHYTKFLTVKPCESVTSEILYEKSFEIFCKEIIEDKIINQHVIYEMTKLTDLFVKVVLREEKEDIKGYRNDRLKYRIQKMYPQIEFVKRSAKYLSELVVCSSTSNNVIELKNRSSTDSEDNEFSLFENHASSSNTLHDLFSAASVMKNIINDAPSMSCEWPPKGKDLTVESSCNCVPIQLFNFLAWCIGASNDVTLDYFVEVTQDTKLKILSIAQDILYLASNGRRQTPKHLALAMTIRHLTGSAKLVGLLNGFGHSISHSCVLEYDTALAYQQQKSNTLLPDGFQKGIFTTLVWDNNDFGEETLTGSGTTHNTNGIILQWEDMPKNSVTLPESNISDFRKKFKKRTLNPPALKLEYFTGKKKYGPSMYKTLPLITEEENRPQQNPSRIIDDIFYLSKTLSKDVLPGWTGYNVAIFNSVERPCKTKIGYLPILDANPTQMSTVNTILHRSLQIADELNIGNLVLVMDQAIYSKAQQIRWQNEQFQKRLVIRMGEFHTTVAFLAVIGKRFCDAGLQDLLIESGVVAQNSINRVLNGHHYNRSIRAHKLLCEALQRLRFKVFLEDHANSVKAKEVIEDFCLSFPTVPVTEIIENEQIQKLLKMYHEYVTVRNSSCLTFELWSSYIEMIEILLLFIRATREGNWELHLSAIRSMLPWFFAYDRINYSRYLSIYWCEMTNLKDTHPDIHAEFMMGKFSVQQQDHYNFSKTACDQVIEQTCNRHTKTKGGLTGITVNKGAVHRWILSHHLRAGISVACENMAGKHITNRNIKELDSSRVKQDELHVLAICESICSMNNPFKNDNDCNFLWNIVSGNVAPENVTMDMRKAFEIGNRAFITFLKDRLCENSSIDFFYPIKCLKLKTFTDIGKNVPLKTENENNALRKNQYLLRRILMISKIQNLNLQDLMKYSLNSVPIALANHDGTKMRTNKATLMHYLEKGSEIDLRSLNITASESAVIVDAMALIQQLQHTANSFGDYALYILKSLIKLAKTFKSNRVDFVSDRYPVISIKSPEHARRSLSGIQIVKIGHHTQKLPKQMKKVLASGVNKEELVEFLFQFWKNQNSNLFEDIILFVTHRDKCHKIFNDAGTLVVESVPELECDHEEADTRLFLHAAHASASLKNIIIKSSDTDVFILGISLARNLNSQLFFASGTTSELNLLNINLISENLGSNISDALIALHVFTGCDSVSSFRGKSKIKALKNMVKSEDYTFAFQNLGKSWNLKTDIIEKLEEFTCELYGQANCSDIDKCRYNWLRLGYVTDNNLPPNKDSLIKHVLRANYQTAIFRRSLFEKIGKPSPIGHGWSIRDNVLYIDWMSLEAVPASIVEHISCKCKKTACVALCSCYRSKVKCTEICACYGCKNCELEADIDFEGDES